MGVNIFFETTSSCRICESSDLHEILHFGKHPPANSFYYPEDEEPPNIPLRLFFCHECSTTQIGESIDPNYLFSKYVWVTGTSKTALDFSYKFSSEVLKRCYGENQFVVEIASNDGTFLRRFQEKGCRVLGIDPAENLAQAASEKGVPTIGCFFHTELANELVREHGFADIIFARNVIPHVKEIHSVIQGISNFLNQNGTGIIEFHDSKLILDELQYDYIYHEHLFYYSLGSISKLLGQHGLEVYDVGRSPISGGSWVIFFSKVQKEKSLALKKAENEELKSGVNTIDRWLAFSKEVMSHREQLKEIIYASKNRILAYGASARSSTLLNYCEVGYRDIFSIIDKNPFKYRMLTPGSMIPIISYEEGLELFNEQKKILLLAWNFREEVIEDLRNSGYQGQFIIPLPEEPRIQ